MANLIKLKRSATSGNNPTTANIELGELAINTFDGNLFFKKSVSGTESILSVATLTGTQTLTNKSLITPVVLGSVVATSNTTQTFAITVVNSGYGNVFAVDGVSTPVLYFVRTGVYTFVQSSASNAGHQLAFKDGAGNSYTTGVVTTGTPGTAGAQTVITVAADAPADLRYYCVAHGNGMGNTITVTGTGGSEIPGQIQLNCPVNTHGQKISAQPHAAAATNTLTLPGGTTIGNANAVLVSDTGTQTLTNKTLSSAVLTGTLTAGGGAGTNGQILVSTGSGVQWVSNTVSTLDSLSDVIISSPVTNQVLKYNGAVFINANPDEAVASAVFAANAESDLGLVTDLTITLTEDLGSVTSVPAEYIYNMGSLVVDGIVSLSNLDQSVKADYISYAIIFGF